MRLNPRKCKSMTVDFLHYNCCLPRPIAVGGSNIEQVSTFKLLGIHLSEDLTWAVHCDYIVKRNNGRLYALRQLKKSKVPSADIAYVYCALIRTPPLCLLTCLSIFLAILRTCKKGPFPSFDLVFRMKQHLTKLHYPLFLTVGQFIGKVRPGNPLYPLIQNRVVPISTSVCLRSVSSRRPVATRTERF